MKRYEGTKRLSAQPMTRGDYNAYRGWEPPAGEDQTTAGYLVEYEDGGKANDSRHAGYISWSPADVFEKSYKEIPIDAPTSLIQPAIKGYRQLNATEGGLMNDVKQHAEQTRELVNRIQRYLDDQSR